jgi:mannitol/fructose-specific phosphotransferase system IIA component (Ntr-type)/galactitol-specific phosphotransferase system IIB component
MEHLGPTIYRLKHGLPLKNPILEEIKTNYEHIFHVVKGGLKALEEYVGTRIPDEEAGYIAIHFGAALERCKSSGARIYRALVVCGTGIGTAKLLSSRLRVEFSNIHIAGTIASHQVKEKFLNEDKNIDLIISTVPTYCDSMPEIIVNPLLPPEDVEKINRYINLHPPKNIERKQGFKPSIEEILAIIERYCTIKSRKELIRALAEYLNLPLYERSKGVVKPVLKDLLTEKTIKLNVDAKDWEEAVRIGGEILVNNGFVEPRYIEAMVNTVKEIGPYIVIAPGIAMPHARPENGVKQVCMSLITLKNPVEFGNIDNDPVDTVICLGAVDNSTHLKALSDLMSLLKDNSKIENVQKATNIKKILDILMMIEEEKAV